MRRGWVLFGALLGAVGLVGPGCGRRETKDYALHPVDVAQVRIHDTFWLPRLETVRDITIPSLLRRCEETGRIDNFARAGGLADGPFRGRRYDDSDLFKLMEGAAHSLRLRFDPDLDGFLDRLIELIAAAQEEDGYLYTARTIDPHHPPAAAGGQRWSRLRASHELYNIGHMIEAAVAHFNATGKRRFLDIAVKAADLIDDTFGPHKRKGFPGHQEIEIALVKLYRVTGKRRYLNLARYFLQERGRLKDHEEAFDPSSPFAVYNRDRYMQTHVPVVEQNEAVGHAVRAVYMYSAMTDLAALLGEDAYQISLRRIWRDVTSTKMYITGGIGSRPESESFGTAFELPNDTAYNETCAAIGTVFWNFRLFLLEGDGRTMDVLERVLYNGLLAGVSLGGDRFFYVNPLEADGETGFNQGSPTRMPWFDCACCPGNLARFLPTLPAYIYASNGSSLFVNLFVQSRVEVELDGRRVSLIQETDYPWNGRVQITVNPEVPLTCAVFLRIPGWARAEPLPGDLYRFLPLDTPEVRIGVNGKRVAPDPAKGYVSLRRKWKPGDRIVLQLPMPVRRILCSSAVSANRNKVALQRGPLVYCFESVDHGGSVLGRVVPDSLDFSAEFNPDVLGGVVILRAREGGGDFPLRAVPYHAWSNRGVGEMAVWMRRTPAGH